LILKVPKPHGSRNTPSFVLRLKYKRDESPGYLDYLDKLLPLVRPGGLILVDNMSQPKPSPDFIRAITTNPHLESIFLNMQSTGISLTLKKP
jgi:caffeoyl-CoA O-methyltransferase